MKHTNYKVEDFINTPTHYITPCPFGEHPSYDFEPFMVGSVACTRCPYFHHDDKKAHTLYCKHP